MPYVPDPSALHQCQYAGMIITKTLNPDTEPDFHRMFYWFFRNTKASVPPRPVVLWLSGGPGASSMGPLFESIGPLIVNKTGTTQDDWEIIPRNNSWADEYNLVFVDQPVDTGFSSGDTIP